MMIKGQQDYETMRQQDRPLLRGQWSVVRGLAAAIALLALATPARADITVNYGFTTNASIPDGNGQYTTSHTLGGIATYNNVSVNLTLSSPNGGNPMWLGDMYSTLTYGLPSETERTAVLLNRPGRDNNDPFGSSLSSLNVTLDDSASHTNIWATTSTTGTFNSDGRLGVNPYGAGVAFSNGDRGNTLTSLNGSAQTSNNFTLLMADTESSGLARLDSWGMAVTGTAAGSGTMSGDGGTFSITDDGGSNNLGAAVVTTQAGGGNLLVTANGNLTFSGVVSGTGGLSKGGTGSLTLSGANTYTGGTILGNGTLNINNASAIGTGTLNISGSTTIDNTSAGDITLSTNNKQDWNGDFTYAGSLGRNLNLGTGNVGLNSATRTVTVSAGTLTVGGIISEGVATGPGDKKEGVLTPSIDPPSLIDPPDPPDGSGAGITKAGAGTLILSGANTYTGATTVNAGKLFINGNSSAATGAVSVNNSGTVLGGTGTVGGSVTVGGGAILRGGMGASTSETLTLNGSVTMQTNSIIELALGASGAHSTLASASGSFTFATAQAFNFFDLGAEATFYNNIITNVGNPGAGISAWTIMNSGWAGTFSFDGTNIDLTLTAVPEPSTWFAAALAFGGVVFSQRRRRRGVGAGVSPAKPAADTAASTRQQSAVATDND